MQFQMCAQCGEKLFSQWKVCPFCAHRIGEVRANSQARRDLSCQQCKGKIEADSQICPHCHAPIIRRYCAGCRRLIPDQAYLCPHCATPATAKRGFFASYGRAILLVAIVTALTGGVAFFIRVNDRVSSMEKPPFDLEKMRPAHKDLSPSTAPPAEPAVTPSFEPAGDSSPHQMESDETTSSVEDVIDATNTVDTAQLQEVSVQAAEMNAARTDDWVARGARLKQGRKLTSYATGLMRQRRYSEATVVLRNAQKAFPSGTNDLSYGETLYKLGICLRKTGRPQQAITALRGAMQFAYYRVHVLREIQAAYGQIEQDRRKSRTTASPTGNRK